VVWTSLTTGRLAAQNGNPPGDVNFTFELNVGDLPASCAFPIRVSMHGKGKTLTLPGSRLIFTSPGLKATVTNLADQSKEVTLNITGSFHVTTKPDGSQVYEITGRNLVLDADAGVVLAIGNFRFAFDAAGNLIQPLTMQGGRLINICTLVD
jgi:hypothetical protein